MVIYNLKGIANHIHAKWKIMHFPCLWLGNIYKCNSTIVNKLWGHVSLRNKASLAKCISGQGLEPQPDFSHGHYPNLSDEKIKQKCEN